MQKKVFIKTFGCQMNEYDSDKMADVLNASDGLIKTDRPGRRRRDSVEYLFGARKGAGKKCFPTWAACVN